MVIVQIHGHDDLRRWFVKTPFKENTLTRVHYGYLEPLSHNATVRLCLSIKTALVLCTVVTLPMYKLMTCMLKYHR